MTRRAALYLRVSTDKQTIENQQIQLRQVAERRGWEVVEVYDDAGICGAKGRADRSGLAGCSTMPAAGISTSCSFGRSTGWVGH
jgi:DNA invertase Pin-like site-specific DNA recombinase